MLPNVLNASEEINDFMKSLDFKHEFLKDYQYLIYQYFLSKYYNKRSLLLLWLSVGRGKTLLSIACGISGLETEMFDKIIILSPKSIQDEFRKNLKLYCKMVYGPKNSSTEYTRLGKHFYMIAYNSWKAYENLLSIKKLNNSLFIIDEAHLFMKSIINVQLEESELKNGNSKAFIGNAKKIYDKIKGLKNKKILALTGTPSAKTPFETVPIFNLAYDKKNIFNENYIQFNEKYIDKEHGTVKNKKELIEKLDGLIAYVPNLNDPTVKVSKLNIIYLEMSKPQYIQYLIDYEKELNEQAYAKNKNVYGLSFGAISSFHAKTFEDCVYYNNHLKNKDGENRHRGKITVDSTHCPKIIRMYNDTTKINGPCVFYFRFTSMYGIESMEIMLKNNGYKKLTKDENPFKEKNKRYIVFSGDIDTDVRDKWKELFNNKKNMYGEYIKYIILSPSGSVGISLKNIRYLGIGSISFNFSELKQILGRANRTNSHIDLPIKDRTLTNNIYIMRKNISYYNKNKKYIDSICYRKAIGSKEVCPSIEEIIYRDSIEDDKINEDFKNNVLIKASITEKLWKKF